MRYNIFSPSDSDILNITTFGYSKNPKTTLFGPGQRNQYIIHYVISGKGFFNSNPVSAGQGFLITPEMCEHYYPDIKNPWSFLWLISEDCKMKSVFEKFNADPDTNIFEYNNIQVIDNIKDFIITNHNNIFTSSELLEIFLHILNRQQTGAKNNDNGAEKLADIYYNYAVNYIKSNLFRPLFVKEITDALGITQPYLYNIFMKKCGASPKKYISLCKLSESKRLLAETDLKTNEIAGSVGYENVLDFYKFFKKMSGYTPGQYKELFKDKNRGC